MGKKKESDLFDDDIGEKLEDLGLDVDDDNDDDDDDDFLNEDDEFENNASLAKVWLDTDAHLKKILLFLENKQLIYSEDSDIPALKQIKGTTPRCNRLGVYDLMTTLSVLSKDLVQANMERDHYLRFMSRNIRDIGRDIVINRRRWEMSHEDMRRIRRLLINNFELFFTRTIGDKERCRFNKNPVSQNPVQDNSFLGKARRLFK